jgi:hypothetical protein
LSFLSKCVSVVSTFLCNSEICCSLT